MDNFTTLAIMAESGHGKDFCGSWIVENQNFVDIAFADHIKRLCYYVLEFGYIPLWGDSDFRNQWINVEWDRAEYRLTWHLDDWLFQLKSLSVEEKANYKSVVKDWLKDLKSKAAALTTDPNPRGNISPRIALQLLGTEYGRNFKKSMWSSLVLDHMIPSIKDGMTYNKDSGLRTRGPREEAKSGAIITDCRFGSELSAVQAAGGYVIKVIRNSRIGKSLKAGMPGHSSEMELQSIPDEAFDLILAMDDGADNVYPRLQKMFDDREFEIRRKEGKTPWISP